MTALYETRNLEFNSTEYVAPGSGLLKGISGSRKHSIVKPN